MMNDAEAANICTLIEDLLTDLRNGNVPAAKLLLVSLVNNLTLKVPLEWSILGNFLIDNLGDSAFRIALLHLLTVVNDSFTPNQPDQEAIQG